MPKIGEVQKLDENPGVLVALQKGYHKLTAHDLALVCKALLDARLHCDFKGLEAGKTYYYKRTSYDGDQLVTVGEVTPKRAQATVSVNHQEPRRIHKGSYPGTFIELDEDLIALAGVTHEAMVKAAVERKLNVPPLVRREYPHLFVEIPKRFATGRFSAIERVKDSLHPMFSMGPVSIADVDKFIEQAHFYITSARCEQTRRTALNSDLFGDYDRLIGGNLDDIDYYRWLRRQIDVGGPLHVPSPRRGKADA
jgi:hypothetical protein